MPRGCLLGVGRAREMLARQNVVGLLWLVAWLVKREYLPRCISYSETCSIQEWQLAKLPCCLGVLSVDIAVT